MIRDSLELLAIREADETIVLLSPAVGSYAAGPSLGEGLVGGSRAGTLTILDRRIDLLLPEGIEGRVVEVRISHRSEPVEYGQPLLVLDAGAAESPGRRLPKAVEAQTAGLAHGEHALRAPTTGIFYSRPDPSSPPFVSAGENLETGQTAGLIEVMKCFSPIVHPGGTIPSPALVARVLVREGEEVRPGQILFVLLPA